MKGTPLNSVKFLNNHALPTKPSSKGDSSGNNQKKSSKEEKVPVKQEPSPPQGAPKEKKKVGVQLDKDGSRATAKTKLDNLRRTILRGLPSALDDCRMLHLVAYSNHYNRLRRQWEEYQEAYQPSGMLSPIRGFAAPEALPKDLFDLLEEAKGKLKEQSDSPGTYSLQAENGASFWDKERPSKDCPEFLQKPLTEEQLGAFEKACLLNSKDTY